MKIQKIKKSLWHRYILYYCIIFIVPFIVLAIFVFKFSVEIVEERFNNNIISNLNQSEKLLASQIEELDNISMHISNDKYISSYRMEHNYYSSAGKEIISRYVNNKSFIDDIVLFYFSSNDKYYSSQGSYNEIDVLMNKYYKDVDILKSTLRKIFYLTTPQIVSLPTHNKDENKFELYYIFPLYDSNGRQCGTTTFLLNEEKLSKILPTVDNNKNEIYITNNSDYVLLSNTKSLDKVFVDSKGKMIKEVSINNTYNIKDKQYRIIKYSSDKLGLNFVNIFDSNDLVTSLINTKMNILKLLVILFLIGLVLILSISYFQYLPIRRIHTILNNKKKNNSDKNNELKSIEMLVTDIIYQNEELLVKNEALYHIDKNQLLLDLIEGVGQDRENKEKHKFILDLESQCHNYYIVLVKKSQLSKESKLSIHNILPTENNRYMTFTIQIPLQDKLGILVVHKDSTISRQESLKDIENKLSILEDNIYFYCGQVYEELAKINHSYIEAMVACDYIVNDSKNRSILYREAKYSNEQIINYPYDIEEKLAHGLKQGTQEVVNDSLKEIFEFINLNKYYSEEIKVYSFYLINFIVRIATLIDFPREEINIRELSKYNNLEIFEENILKLVDSINKFVLSKRSKVRDKFREGIFTDILQNYRSHDLSLELISQKYDYSVPYLSKMIKEETGTTFTKYIQDLRFNYIKEKLVETDLSIKEIIFQAGYYDISNFSRKFKNIMGVTPGQYREINKESKNLEIL